MQNGGIFLRKMIEIVGKSDTLILHFINRQIDKPGFGKGMKALPSGTNKMTKN